MLKLQFHTGEQEKLFPARELPEFSGAEVMSYPYGMEHSSKSAGDD